jgi:hypothetical protein
LLAALGAGRSAASADLRPVRLDSEVHTLAWPNGADFDPATLHDWPDHVQAFVSQARSWAAAGERSA